MGLRCRHGHCLTRRGGVPAADSGPASSRGIPAALVGSVLLLASIALILWVVARRPDRLTRWSAWRSSPSPSTTSSPTRVHERYVATRSSPSIVILAAASVRWRWAYAALTAATFANMYVVLTTLYPNNPSIGRDWLGIGWAIRSEPGVDSMALVHVAAFLDVPPAPAGSRLATRRRRAPSGDPEDLAPPRRLAPPATPARRAAFCRSAHPVYRRREGRTTGSQGVSSAARPTARAALGSRKLAHRPGAPRRPRCPCSRHGRPGRASPSSAWSAGSGRASAEPPTRPDRTAALARERGGRLDRLDLWLVVVLVLASLLLRTFRLAEPYQMHFDEVYHARTATEFLQDWRYGLSHDIYEWTHPHLAKYVMAAGIVLWGGDEVRATSALGVSVRAAVVEPRRATPGSRRTAGRRAAPRGDRQRDPDLRPADPRALLSVVLAEEVGAIAFDPVDNR